VRRRFHPTERIKLDLRLEFFNIFNHPMFMPDGNTVFWGNSATALPTFGKVTQTPNNALGGLNPIYQIGGPRSGQITLRLSF